MLKSQNFGICLDAFYKLGFGNLVNFLVGVAKVRREGSPQDVELISAFA